MRKQFDKALELLKINKELINDLNSNIDIKISECLLLFYTKRYTDCKALCISLAHENNSEYIFQALLFLSNYHLNNNKQNLTTSSSPKIHKLLNDHLTKGKIKTTEIKNLIVIKNKYLLHWNLLLKQ